MVTPTVGHRQRVAAPLLQAAAGHGAALLEQFNALDGEKKGTGHDGYPSRPRSDPEFQSRVGNDARAASTYADVYEPS